MSRKTAIRITNAEIRRSEYREAVKRDRERAANPPSTLDVLRAARNQMDERELWRLCQSAARLELQGWDAEDRLDCAAAIMMHVLSETHGAPPRRDSERVRFHRLCLLAKNWRTVTNRYRAMVKRALKAEEDRQGATAAAVYAVIDGRPLDAELADAEASATRAAIVAERICDVLELPHAGPTFAAIYQGARGETAEVCATERQVKLSAWKMRVKRGQDHIRAVFPDAGSLIEAIRAASDAAPIHSRPLTPWPTREGTNAGDAPSVPQSAQEARELCTLRHTIPTPGLAATSLSARRRGYYVAYRPTADATQQVTYRVPGKRQTAAEHRAAALRRMAIAAAQQARRDRGIRPREAGATMVERV